MSSEGGAKSHRELLLDFDMNQKTYNIFLDGFQNCYGSGTPLCLTFYPVLSRNGRSHYPMPIPPRHIRHVEAQKLSLYFHKSTSPKERYSRTCT